MTAPTVLELFAGIGGMTLGLERAGFRCVGQVEIDPWCRRVLAKHWPEVPRHDDVRTAIEWWDSEPRPRVDCVAGGYPCPGESLAGRRLGTDDPRWLWPEMARVIAHIRPRLVIGENVIGHRTKGLRFVLRDLERLGYTATPGVVRACEMGAPHARARVFTLAYASGEGRDQGWSERRVEGTQPTGESRWPRLEPVGRAWWAVEPGMGRVAYGVPGRVDRVRGLGNAVVPAVAEHIGRIALTGLCDE